MKKILVTGFEPFGNVEVNPSQEIINLLDNEKYSIHLLPVSYSRGKEELERIIKKEKPIFCLHLGAASLRDKISLEIRAHNLMGGNIDNDNECPKVDSIIKDKPIILYSKINCNELVDILGEEVVTSGDAGLFICNMIYYLSLDKTDRNSLFIHLPLFSSISKERQLIIVNKVLEIIENKYIK